MHLGASRTLPQVNRPSLTPPPAHVWSGTEKIVTLGVVLSIVFAAIVGMSRSADVTTSPSSLRSAASVALAPSVPSLSAADSVRFRERASAIVAEFRPAGWKDEDVARLSSLADTVTLFGDTTHAPVREWLVAKREGDERRLREQAEAAERAADAAKWSYSSATDPMTSRVARTATIQSENTVNFDFPYQGEQRGRLMLRNHPSYGRDILLHIGSGQFLCPSYDGCSVRIRFDEGPAERWHANAAADHSTTVIFISGYSRFVERMRRARTVRIQAEIYQEGSPTFEFRTGGFDRERFASGS
jgi:hypothetical protein